jgi:hypothetical protein
MRLYHWIARLTIFAALAAASFGGGWKWEVFPH